MYTKKHSIVNRIQRVAIGRPKTAIAVVAALTLLFGFFLLRVKIDSDLQSFLPDEERSYSLRERDSESSPSRLLVVSAEKREGLTVENLSELQDAYDKIEAIPGIKPGITPFNLFMFRYENRRIGITTLSPEGLPPADDTELERFIENVTHSDIAGNFVVSLDGNVFFAYFPVGKETDTAAAMTELRNILAPLDTMFITHITGSIPIDTRLSFLLKRNFSILLTIAISIILVFFYLGFRSKRGVILPTLVVSLGTVWSIGFMSMAGFKLTMMSIILPPIVLTLGSSYSIHILNHFYYHKDQPDGSEESLDFSHTNKTVLLASLTTIIGFLSLMTTGNPITMQFAVTAAFGIFVCALLALFFLPAVLNLFAIKESQKRKPKRDPIFRFVSALPGIITSRYRLLILILAAIPVLFGFTLRLIDFNTDPMSYFPSRDPVINDMYYFTNRIGGFDYIYLTFRTPDNQRGPFLDPETLESLFLIEQKLRENPDICDTISFTSLLADLNRTMNGIYGTPESKGAILLLSRYVSLYTKNNPSLYFGSIADEDYSQLTFSLRVYNSEKKTFIDEVRLRKILKETEAILSESLPEGIEYTFSGKSLKYLYLSDIFKQNLWSSIAASLISIFLVVLITFRSIALTALTLIPLFTGIFINFILMALFGIPLDMTTTMVFSIAIGVGIDDAIHFLLQYKRQKTLFPSEPDTVLRNTLIITGRPIILTTVSIIAGFLVLLAASFKPIAFFGILVIFILFASTSGTLLFVPSLIRLFSRGNTKPQRRIKHGKLPPG